jgi:hypothetical protein
VRAAKGAREGSALGGAMPSAAVGVGTGH